MTSAPPARVVGAVVVTYNRRDLVRAALAGIVGQSSAPDLVIVVDNASTDDTATMVRTDFPTARLIRTTENVGGAGGFAVGIGAALEAGVDLVWVMDDDAVPEPDALAALLTAYDAAPTRPAVVASRVVGPDGTAHPMNTPRSRPFASRRSRREAAAAGCIPIRSASFVSILVDAERCREQGLPVADYFLWNDDFEYTSRLLRRGTGLLCPESVVVHRAVPVPLAQVAPDRLFFEARNKVWALSRSPAFRPGERLLYAGVALGRWSAAVAHADDRRSVLRALGRGVAAGVRRKPRPNDAVLSAATGHSTPR